MPRSVEFDLSDLLIVSDVSLTNSCEEIEFVESGEVKCDGDMCWVSVSVQPASLSGKHRCPRCWKHVSTAPEELCNRCRTVERDL